MIVSRGIHFVLLIFLSSMIVILVSCSRSSNNNNSKKEQNHAKKSELSKKEIILIANKEAQEHGYEIGRMPDKYKVVYDVDNLMWKKRFLDTDPNNRHSNIDLTDLKDHDYQVVIYKLRSFPPFVGYVGGPFWICIDKKTGEVLKVWGEM
jgi:hypothetical protein